MITKDETVEDMTHTNLQMSSRHAACPDIIPRTKSQESDPSLKHAEATEPKRRQEWTMEALIQTGIGRVAPRKVNGWIWEWNTLIQHETFFRCREKLQLMFIPLKPNWKQNMVPGRQVDVLPCFTNRWRQLRVLEIGLSLNIEGIWVS